MIYNLIINFQTYLKFNYLIITLNDQLSGRNIFLRVLVSLSLSLFLKVIFFELFLVAQVLNNHVCIILICGSFTIKANENFLVS